MAFSQNNIPSWLLCVFSFGLFVLKSVLSLRGACMFQALGIIRESKAARHPELQPVYLLKTMLQPSN